MGSQISQMSSSQITVIEMTHPSKNDWLTKHATVTGLAIVEVERLWLRFSQLGCNEDGNLTADIFSRPPASQDIFIKNILTTFKGAKAVISFQDFLNAMKWAESAETSKKIAGVFYLLNNGNPVTKEVLYKIMRRTYTEETEDNIQRITSVFMEQIDDTRQGSFTEQQFVRWVSNMPQHEVESILDFQIIPLALNEEAQKQFSSLPSRDATFIIATKDSKNVTHSPPSNPVDTSPHQKKVNPTSNEQSISRQVPTDAVLREIANKINKRDWHILANRLGFTSTEISTYERISSLKKDQCYEMMKAWREREGTSAYAENLERALRESKMNDAALLLYP